MKDKNIIKLEKHQKRHARIRAKISGTAKCPRVSVFKSNTGLYVQLIDDAKSITIVSVNSKELKSKATKTEKALELGKLLAQKAADKKVKTVVFDKSGYKFHGIIKAVADGAREGGLNF